MCYSARIQADYAKYRRQYGADIDIDEFTRLYFQRLREPKAVKTPRELDLAFLRGSSDAEKAIAEAITAADRVAIAAMQQQLAAQVERLAKAEAALAAGKVTKKATEDHRIATDKIAQLKARLVDLRRATPAAEGARIYPGTYAPVLTWHSGRRVLKPMRYQCRPEGKPALYDRRYPGTYNARRDNLEGFWRVLFGFRHGVVVADAFYEHVEQDGKNVILEFRPDTGEPLLAACLWSEWGQGDERLLSFAAITDAPPPEVAAAGHDRCIIPIRPENLDAWLQPDPADLATSYAILDDRARPYYEHRLAA